MKMSLITILKTIKESDEAYDLALKHSLSILRDFHKLSPFGREIMLDIIIDLISLDTPPDYLYSNITRVSVAEQLTLNQ